MKKRLINQVLAALAVTVLFAAQTSTAFAVAEPGVAVAADAGVEYLESQQQIDGSIDGFGSETEWTVIAVVANGDDPHDIKIEEGVSLVEFLEEDAPSEMAPSTDIERKMIAIAAAGEDTTDFGGFNYDEALESRHEDGQIISYTQQFNESWEPVLDDEGNPVYVKDDTLLNDDWFGIIAIEAADAEELKPVAQDSLDFIIDNQKENGGFSYTTVDCGVYCVENSNDTAAAIISFDAAKQLGLVNDDLESATDSAVVFLLSTRNDDGGFGYTPGDISDAGSTSWGLMALNTLGDLYKDAIGAAREWLLANQNDDGGFGYVPGTSDTFTTPHAVIALNGTTWKLTPEPVQHPEEDAQEPIVATPIETPVIAKVASAVSNVVSTYRASTATATPVEAEPTEPQTSSTVSPEVKSDVTPETEETEGSSAGRIVGYILIALALAGFLGYIFRLRSAKTAE